MPGFTKESTRQQEDAWNRRTGRLIFAVGLALLLAPVIQYGPKGLVVTVLAAIGTAASVIGWLEMKA